jgi:predicted amidohydrolase
MQRLARLLDTNQAEHSLRQALVRLWLLAAAPGQLNRWEQQENEPSVQKTLPDFRARLDTEAAFKATEIQQQPLTLIRALDEHLAAQRRAGLNKRVGAGRTCLTENGKDHWLVPVVLQTRRGASLARQASNHARWFQHHAVLPALTAHGQQVTLEASSSMLDTALQTLASQRNAALNVWVAHFDDGADVQWTREFSPVNNWRATEVQPHQARAASVATTLDNARRAGAHVVVFPEFTVDIAHRSHIVQLLRNQPQDSPVQLVVAGSFHEPVAPGGSGHVHPQHAAYNTAPVFNGQGRVLWSHQKLRLFGDNRHGSEHAEVGNRLHVLLTPLGCMTVLICKDFLDEHESVSDLLKEVPVDWVWVPSFGDDKTLKAHQAEAKRLASITPGTSSVVAQTQNTVLAPPGTSLPPLPGFGHAAGQSDPTPCVGVTGGVLSFPVGLQFESPTTPQPPPPKHPTLKRIK